MLNLPESTANIIFGSLLGILGGLISVPFNAAIMRFIKKDEQLYQHKLDLIAKERELILQHRLELKQAELQNNEIGRLRGYISSLEKRIVDLENAKAHE